MVAIPWFVLATTGSAVLTGLVAFVESTPYVLSLALGGPFVDRVGAWRVAVVSDVVAAVLVAAVPVLHLLGRLPVGALMLLVGLAGGVRGLGSATSVLLPGLAERAGTPIERATGLRDGMNRVAGMVGLPLAGVLMTVWSAPVVLLLDAASFVVAAALIGTMVDRSVLPSRRETEAAAVGTRSGYVAELRAGLAFLRRDRLLVAIAVMVFVTNLLDQAYSVVLVPVWVRDAVGSPLGLGLVGGVFGIGAVAGAAMFAWLGPRLPRRQSFAWGFLVGGAPRFLTLAVASTLPPVLLVCVLAGLGVGAINPALSSTEYERVPVHLQARVLGVLGALAWGGVPLGALVGGLAVGAVGLTATLVGFGCLYLLATLSPFLLPVWREMDRGRAGRAAHEPGAVADSG